MKRNFTLFNTEKPRLNKTQITTFEIVVESQETWQIMKYHDFSSSGLSAIVLKGKQTFSLLFKILLLLSQFEM